MSGNDEGGYTLWTVIKAVLITLGLVYIMSLVSWFAHWAVVLLAISGVGYAGYRVAKALKSEPNATPKLLTSETPFDQRLRQLEEEERVLDRQIGL